MRTTATHLSCKFQVGSANSAELWTLCHFTTWVTIHQLPLQYSSSTIPRQSIPLMWTALAGGHSHFHTFLSCLDSRISHYLDWSLTVMKTLMPFNIVECDGHSLPCTTFFSMSCVTVGQKLLFPQNLMTACCWIKVIFVKSDISTENRVIKKKFFPLSNLHGC